MTGAGAIDAVGIVVPVHDEAALLPACLASLDAALPPGLRRVAVIALDACTDASAEIARRWATGRIDRRYLLLDARNVGQARTAGMARALAELADIPPARLWLATTDADTLVPSTWLADQLALAARGARAVAGTIRVANWEGHPAGIAARFADHYAPAGSGDHHPHIHGANLGVRADAYLAVGGFAPLPTGEDHALWNALQAAAQPCVATRTIEVSTSARRHGRAPGGFARFLRDLEGE
ncbi:MAG TPA: glycosyltransferase family A protein [Kofleriaceae bacterium]